MHHRRILVLDTPEHDLDTLLEAFASVCGERAVERANGRDELLDRLRSGEPWDLVVIDADLGDGEHDGRAVLAEVRSLDPLLPVVVVAADGDVDAAARAIESGASDFLVRRHRLGDRVETLMRKVQQWLRLVDRNRALERENRALRETYLERWHMVGSSAELRDIAHRIERVAKVPRPVLVVGERGTGKELVARAIHEASGANGAFIAVNCAAVPDALLEAELFGHERGAFTGADRRAAGKFEAAHGGTLFLDEIGHMSPPFQQTILRVVEYGAFLRVGGTEEVQVRTRIIAATNVDLRAKIRGGEFLPDLHDRLAFEEIRVPPLRERSADVPALARYFLERFTLEVPALRGKRLSDEALAALRRHPFPGNVRELKHIIERAAYRETGDELTPEDLGLGDEPVPAPAARGEGTFKDRIEALERELIERALADANGNQAEAARRLGLSYHQFRYYRGKHGKA